MNLLYSLLALATLVPATLLPLRAARSNAQAPRRDGLYWSLLLLAFAGPALWVVAQTMDGWRTGFAIALWVTVAMSLAVFVAVAALVREAWRLTPLLLPYLLLLGLVATIWSQGETGHLLAAAPGFWVQFHIAVSVTTYALLTIAAVAGLAVMVQERALKAKRPTALTRLLPSAVDGEALQLHLLKLSAVVLGLGLVTGMASTWISQGVLLAFDHKTMFALLGFAVICILLLVHYRTGVGGRRAARWVLLAYLLLTLGYPGVKFVTDVVLA